LGERTKNSLGSLTNTGLARSYRNTGYFTRRVSAKTACSGRERGFRESEKFRLRDDPRPRRGGDNGTPPRKPGSGSAEAQSEEASCGLKENRGSFRVRYLYRYLVFINPRKPHAPLTLLITKYGGFAIADREYPVRATKPP